MSNEWLTTGQLIDTLKIGQIAECFLEEKPRRIKRLESGIYWCNEKGTIIDAGEIVYLGSALMKWKWRILPNYVSFEEAMKALKEGKTVSLHIEGEVYTVTHYEADTYRLSAMSFEHYGLIPIMKADWTIEVDTP